MWPFKRAAPEEEQRAIAMWPWDIGGPPPYATRTVSVERALSLVPVFGAIRLLADTISSLTPALYKTGAHGLPVRQPDPSLFVNPSVHGTVPDWLHRGVASQASQGDAIGLITQRAYTGTGLGYPTMIEWLNPQEVVVIDNNPTGPGSFMNPQWYWRNRLVPSENLLHIPWFTMPYRVRGLSPIAAFAATAQVGLAAQDYAASWFDNGGVPPGTFQNTKQVVDKEQADAITARVTSRLQTRKPLVYGCDWIYNPIAIKPHEAQFVETMQLTATQIAVMYGLPPEKIGGTTGQSLTYSTVEMNTLDYLTFCARPWFVRWEKALSNCFPRGTYVKFLTDEMLRSDAKTKAQISALSLGTPSQAWKQVDEVRGEYDLAPMPKPEPVELPPPAPATTPPLPPAAANGKPAPMAAVKGTTNGNRQQ